MDGMYVNTSSLKGPSIHPSTSPHTHTCALNAASSACIRSQCGADSAAGVFLASSSVMYASFASVSAIHRPGSVSSLACFSASSCLNCGGCGMGESGCVGR